MKKNQWSQKMNCILSKSHHWEHRSQLLSHQSPRSNLHHHHGITWNHQSKRIIRTSIPWALLFRCFSTPPWNSTLQVMENLISMMMSSTSWSQGCCILSIIRSDQAPMQSSAAMHSAKYPFSTKPQKRSLASHTEKLWEGESMNSCRPILQLVRYGSLVATVESKKISDQQFWSSAWFLPCYLSRYRHNGIFQSQTTDHMSQERWCRYTHRDNSNGN